MNVPSTSTVAPDDTVNEEALVKLKLDVVVAFEIMLHPPVGPSMVRILKVEVAVLMVFPVCVPLNLTVPDWWTKRAPD